MNDKARGGIGRSNIDGIKGEVGTEPKCINRTRRRNGGFPFRRLSNRRERYWSNSRHISTGEEEEEEEETVGCFRE